MRTKAEFNAWRARRCRTNIITWAVLFATASSATVVSIMSATLGNGAAAICGAAMAATGWRLFDAIHTDNLRRKYG